MTTSRHESRRQLGRGRIAWTGAALGMVALASSAAVVPMASAQAAVSKSEAVVKVVNRPPFGKMLATVTGASLYTASGACTGGCLRIWPPLLMEKGKTTPTGVAGLGTAALTIGASHDVQVTYKGKRLYRFYLDTGTRVTGNGVGGFKVAKVG